MTKTEFKNYAKANGVYSASLLANALHVTLATVQLWIRTL